MQKKQHKGAGLENSRLPPTTRSNKPEFMQTRGGNLVVATLFLAILCFTFAVAFLLYNEQLKQEKTTTDIISRAAMHNLQHDIFELERYVSRISQVYQASPTMDRKTFWRSMRQPIRDLKTVQSIAWAPKVSKHQLTAWINSQKAAKQTLMIYQVTRALRDLEPLYYQASGDWLNSPQPDSDVSYIQSMVAPILYIEDEMGKVLNSAKHFREAIEQAAISGEITASSSEINHKDKSISLLFSPIYSEQLSLGDRKDLRRDRKKSIAGVLSFKVDAGLLIESRFAQNKSHRLGITVSELSEKTETVLFSNNEMPFGHYINSTEEVKFFGNTWRITVHREALSSAIILPPALATIVGLMMMAVLLIWHASNRRFGQELHAKLEEQRLEISNKTSLLEAVLAAAPVGIEYIDENDAVQLQNNLSAISLSSASAHTAIADGFATPIGKTHHNEHKLEHYRLNTTTSGQTKYFELISKEIAKETEDCSEDQKFGKIIVCSDVTERELSKQKLESYVRELEQMHQELEDFTYSVTHDMQEPLRRIASFAEILSDQIAEDDATQSTEISEKLALSATDLRNRFSRIVTEIDSRNERKKVNVHAPATKVDPSSDNEIRKDDAHGKRHK